MPENLVNSKFPLSWLRTKGVKNFPNERNYFPNEDFGRKMGFTRHPLLTILFELFLTKRLFLPEISKIKFMFGVC